MSTLKKIPVGLQSFLELIEDRYILDFPNREVRESFFTHLRFLPFGSTESN